jgi:hypothetical protein
MVCCMEGARANNAEQVKSEVTDKLLDRVKIEKEKDKSDSTLYVRFSTLCFIDSYKAHYALAAPDFFYSQAAT